YPVPKVFKSAPVVVVAAPACHEIHLHRGHAHALAQIYLLGLNSHFFNVFEAGLETGCSVATKFHAARGRHDTVDGVALSCQREAVPSTGAARTTEARREVGKRVDVAPR